ncbi:hypothetical protein BV20DRAFT_96339 [Pilatotrama ljubarskyi]|nr:hypothetical protein BV20DRAFT_96339 [Pilatotrama ljubarskyi]
MSPRIRRSPALSAQRSGRRTSNEYAFLCFPPDSGFRRPLCWSRSIYCGLLIIPHSRSCEVPMQRHTGDNIGLDNQGNGVRSRARWRASRMITGRAVRRTSLWFPSSGAHAIVPVGEGSRHHGGCLVCPSFCTAWSACWLEQPGYFAAGAQPGS